MKKVYVVGTCDTKQRELLFVKSAILATGAVAILVDVSTGNANGIADVSAETVARYHPNGIGSVLGLHDRGAAVSAMAKALTFFLAAQSDVGGIIGMGGGGNTALVTEAMRSLPIGLPKLMVSTIASGDVGPFVGPTDICLMYSVTDIAGLNRINRVVLENAAHAIAGMVNHHQPRIQPARPAIALTQFGVTTPCLDRIRGKLEDHYECLVFHCTGIGGQTMEKLVDSGLVDGVLDITTTEVADYLVGGVLACTEDRFGAIARTQTPCVVSCGALDMVNFGPRSTVPAEFAQRNFHMHNPYVTLMRTTPEENTRFGEWIATRLNACEGPLVMLIPEGGLSALDAPGMPFYDVEADAALFEALRRTFQPNRKRRLISSPLHINDPLFAETAVELFKEIVD